jgi:transposase-like protein
MGPFSSSSLRADLPEFGSIDEIRHLVDDDRAAREWLERLIWPHGPACPHCGSLKVWRFREKDRRSRRGLFECHDCKDQFTVTTKTPLHATKLPLGKWLLALYIVLSSSKGISSVVLARMIGVTQRTAWKMGHAIRELLADRPDLREPLTGQVEVDTTFVGGAPNSGMFGDNKRGKGTKKARVLVASERGGHARAKMIDAESVEVMGPAVREIVDKRSTLMTDGDRALAAIGKDFAGHAAVRHSTGDYVIGDAHVNSAEAHAALLQRAVFGVYHQLSKKHMQRYLDEAAFRWRHRHIIVEPREVEGRMRRRKRVVLTPFDQQLEELLRGAVGRQVRFSADGGLTWPPKGPQPRRQYRRRPKRARARIRLSRSDQSGSPLRG